MRYEIETDEGFSREDLLQELGRLERKALGVVKHAKRVTTSFTPVRSEADLIALSPLRDE
jgi:hypothetical protein